MAKLSSIKTGHRIKLLRLEKGITQRTLAEKLSKSESAVRMWELGKSEPDICTLNRLADIFSVSPAYLTGWTDNKNGEKQEVI